MHTLELAVSLIAAVVIMRFFKLGNDEMGVVVGVVVNALSKFARASDLSPVPDFVNSKK